MKKIMMSLICLLMVMVGAFALTGCNSESNSLVGFDIDLARALAKDLNIEVEFKEIDWDTKEADLEAGNIDCVWNGFTYTEDRDNGYYDEERGTQIGGLEFTDMYMVNKQVAVIRKADQDKFTTKDAFVKAKGCAEAGSAGLDVITDVIKGSAAGLDKQLTIFTELQAKTSDYGVMDSIMANYYVNNNKNYKKDLMVIELSEFNVESEYYAIAFKEGSNLSAVFNYELAKLFENKTVEEIAKTYGLEDVIYNGFAKYNVSDFTFPTDGAYQQVMNKKKIVIGYTLFAPIAFEK